MFDFHDETQAARIQQFTLNLRNLQIPPRIAPQFSFDLGYPVFNYYAPFPYWVTSAIHLAGFDIADSTKISFLFAIVIGFIFMFLFLNLFNGFFPSLLGAALYSTSPWLAVEIFIRGNLGEVWFMGLMPLVFYLIYKNRKYSSPLIFLMTTLFLGFILTSHNILSLIFLPVVFIYILLLENKLKNLLSLFLAFAISSYFFIPAVLEIGFTQAMTIAKNTSYTSHFLCLSQIWTTPSWGYGGSTPGCTDDGMSFMLGKPQILFFLVGLTTLFAYLKRIEYFRLILFFGLGTFLAIFLTLYQSSFLFGFFKPIFSLFQFPWRFLSFALFGLAFIAGQLQIPTKYKKLALILIIPVFAVFFYNAKFFTKLMLSKEKYNLEFLSNVYISQRVAYKVSEYLPSAASYKSWLELEPQKNSQEIKDPTLVDYNFVSAFDGGSIKTIKNEPFVKQAETKSKKILVDIHYLPYWKILINGNDYIPTVFDKLGRPIIDLVGKSVITVKYQQTPVEVFSNIFTTLSFALLLAMVVIKPIWIKIKSLK
ncbi:MAG: hypothetical protein UR68_C0018G0019 [Candidatus Roizmanbacteria bacterium GW2011_GWA2_35_19]|uniref:Membrane protein 6-pyruvoyl-tetrahydropterin synthase-related domain-containing protein n=2 Tax=Candidatus Roizmaniibacteriota TaxID=1752723 RepID=A0A0G0BS35_9BACT|nr:MAG: hypothetical protein UR63_C0009G0013 [Candidatus Roizmanbacteria bacterium GW2011_GWC2_35_12]KKP72299.1 MAG: hypothetical protein UR68_C0018G0019 [Candidatus Roizmanbacteria bacterium GW2011_GWA2_35_19]